MATQCMFNNVSGLLRTEGLAFKPGIAQICATFDNLKSVYDVPLPWLSDPARVVLRVMQTMRMSVNCPFSGPVVNRSAPNSAILINVSITSWGWVLFMPYLIQKLIGFAIPNIFSSIKTSFHALCQGSHGWNISRVSPLWWPRDCQKTKDNPLSFPISTLQD